MHAQICGSVAGVGPDPEFANDIGPNALGDSREVILHASVTNKYGLRTRDLDCNLRHHCCQHPRTELRKGRVGGGIRG